MKYVLVTGAGGGIRQICFSLTTELQLECVAVSILRAGAVKTNMPDVSITALDGFCDKTQMYVCNANVLKRLSTVWKPKAFLLKKLPQGSAKF